MKGGGRGFLNFFIANYNSGPWAAAFSNWLCYYVNEIKTINTVIICVLSGVITCKSSANRRARGADTHTRTHTRGHRDRGRNCVLSCNYLLCSCIMTCICAYVHGQHTAGELVVQINWLHRAVSRARRAGDIFTRFVSSALYARRSGRW